MTQKFKTNFQVDHTSFYELRQQNLLLEGMMNHHFHQTRGSLELLELLGNYSHDFRYFLDNDHETYTSHDPQNHLVDSIADKVCDKIKTG